MKKLIAGNWKMNGSLSANSQLLLSLRTGLVEPACQIAVCIPAIYAYQGQTLLSNCPMALGAQDISAYDNGAYTGEISGSMLKEFGVRYAIVGHSERRQYHGETDETVAAKAKRALSYDITPIVCVGETLAEREAGQTGDVVSRQLSVVIAALGEDISKIVLAYEPVWAIGTGKTATPMQAQQVHAMLRSQLKAASDGADSIQILYGGSMNAVTAGELLRQPDIDGGLVGGASLKLLDFLAIIAACA